MRWACPIPSLGLRMGRSKTCFLCLPHAVLMHWLYKCMIKDSAGLVEHSHLVQWGNELNSGIFSCIHTNQRVLQAFVESVLCLSFVGQSSWLTALCVGLYSDVLCLSRGHSSACEAHSLFPIRVSYLCYCAVSFGLIKLTSQVAVEGGVFYCSLVHRLCIFHFQ